MEKDTLIKILNVKKSYQGGFEALKGVNLEINRGEILALLGPNGAGKTTLINAICGIVVPSSGSITVDNHDVGFGARTLLYSSGGVWSCVV